MKTYKVGTTRYRGHAPGETFEADPQDPAIARALQRGSITEGAAAPPAPKPEKPAGDEEDEVGGLMSKRPFSKASDKEKE